MFPIDGKDGWVFLSMCSFDVVCRLVLSLVLSWIWTHIKSYWEINSVLGGKSLATALAIAYGCLFEKHRHPAVIWGRSSIFQVSQLRSHPRTARAAPGAALRCWSCWDSRSSHSKVSCQAEEPVFPLGLVPFLSVPYECLCSIESVAGYLRLTHCSVPRVSDGLQCLLMRIISGRKWPEAFQTGGMDLPQRNRAGEVLSGPQLLLLSFREKKKAKNFTCVWLRSGRKVVSVTAEQRYPTGCPASESYWSFPEGDHDFNVEILYLGDFLCSFKILEI